MKMKKKLLALAIGTTASATLSFSALAAITGYEMRVSTKVVNGDWLGLSPEYTDWINEGGLYDCNNWSPATSVVDYGQSYLQSRVCQQDQVREAILKEQHTGSGEVREVKRVPQSQVVDIEESQVAIGDRRDWDTFESTFTDWIDISAPHSYTAWAPAPGAQITNYTQGQSFEVTQERFEQRRQRDSVTGDIRDNGDPVRQEREDSRTDTRSVAVSSSEWVNVSEPVCGAWSPLPLSVDFGQTYTQTRTCDQSQERVWAHTTSGGEIHSRSETRTNTFDEVQEAVGERRDWQPIASEFTNWVDVGARFAYSIWTPAVDNQVESFAQSRDFKQTQERFEQRREQDQVTGDMKDLGDPIRETQTISGSETQTVDVIVSNWSNAGAIFDCTAWSPAPETVNMGEVFTQTRACQQDQTRTRTYRAGGNTLESQTDAKTIEVTESQQATGVLQDWQPMASTFTAWSNVGERTGYSTWLPAIGNQTTTFGQSRDYDQLQERFEQRREKDLITGDVRNIGEPIRQTQTIAGDETRTIEVLVSSWTNAGAIFDCTAWNPAPETVNMGEVFTQTRACQQDQTRTRTYRAGGNTLESQTDAKTIEVTESQQATGVLQDWQPMASTFTAWSNVGERTGYSTWLPAIGNQTTTFGQTRDYDQLQERFEQRREKDLVTGDIRNVGEPIRQTQTIAGDESRTIEVLVSSWTNAGAIFDCTAWDPKPETVNKGTVFTQTRACKQDQTRTRTYRAGGNALDSQTDAKTIEVTETQQATGVLQDWQPLASTFTAWSNVGERTGYSTWLPAIGNQTTTFDQSRDYDQLQERFEQRREKDQVTGDIRNVGEPIRQTQTIAGDESRTIEVLVSSWSNTGAIYDCTAWDPKPETVNKGTIFTQTRACQQDQTRTRTYRTNGSTMQTKSDSQTVQVSETQQATGELQDWQPTDSTYTAWTNEGARYNYSSWSPAAVAQTADFTQSRSYSQDQVRYEQKRERDAVTGVERNVGLPVRQEKTVQGSESRDIVVSWSNWANAGGRENCSAWSPSPSTVNFGEAFTQSRNCEQPQTRDRIYKSGLSTVNSVEETRRDPVTENRTATGSRQDWQPIASTYTAWMNDGGAYGHSAWGPAPATQTASFTQTRTYKQDQDRYEQKREQDQVTSSIRNVGDPVLHEQTLNKSQTRPVTVTWTDWADRGDTFNCSDWTPDPITIDKGQTYTQTRNCSQNQARDRLYKSGTTTLNSVEEAQVVNKTESRQAVGDYQNWRPTTSTYTAWLDDGAPINYGSWSPAAEHQVVAFTQAQPYDQPQARYEQKRERDEVTGEIRTVGEPIKRTRLDDRSRDRLISVSYTAWDNTGIHYNCGNWTPSPASVPKGQTFTQTRNCSQDQQRTRLYKDGTTTIASGNEVKTIYEEEARTSTGTLQQWQSIAPTYTAWTDNGSPTNYTSWSPAPSNETSSFIQRRTYEQPQSRQRQGREQDLITGEIRDDGAPTTETRMDPRTDSRTVTVSWSSWTNNGADVNCSAWGPSTDTVDMGQNFTQTRSCEEPEKRTRTYHADGSTIATANETRLNPVTRSRTATGTRQDWMPADSTYTAWTNEGARYGYTTWYPAPSTQTADFNQTRAYSQDQTRTEQQREQDTVTGEYRNVGAPIQRTRTVTGEETRPVTVSYTSWTNSGGVTSCSAWSPARDTVPNGQSFTQTRTCDQPQSRDRVYKHNTTTLHTAPETRTVSVTQENPTTGTMSNWQPMTSSASSWSNSGGRYNYTAWSPAPTTQTADYTQTRSYSQNQTRTVQQREYDSVTGDTRNVGEPTTETRTISGTESRLVDVSYTSWVRDSSAYTCSGWSPATSTVTSGQSFTQSRTCYYYERRDRRYYWSSTHLKTQQETRSVSVRSTRTATGTYTSTPTCTDGCK